MGTRWVPLNFQRRFGILSAQLNSFLLCGNQYDAPLLRVRRAIIPKKDEVFVRERTYELMYIVDPSIGGDDEYAGVVNRINTAITNAGAMLSDEEVLGPTGRRKLAYTIRHNGKDLSEGFYVLLRFRGQPSQVATIERSIKLTEPVVRYLVTVPHA